MKKINYLLKKMKKSALLHVNDKDFERYIFVDVKDTTDKAIKLLIDNIMQHASGVQSA